MTTIDARYVQLHPGSAAMFGKAVDLFPDGVTHDGRRFSPSRYIWTTVWAPESGTLTVTSTSDIPHIRLRVSKEPAILHDGDGRGIRERRQLSHRAHKTISRCRELASARQRRRLSARLHTLQLIQVHSSPLATPVTSDDPKDTRYPGVGWSPPIRSSTCRNTSRGTAPSAS